MSELRTDLPLIRDPDLIAAEMDGDVVMMSIENGEYYGVGGIGPRIWELLEQAITVEQLTAAICAEYDVEEDRCREDLLGFAEQLLAMGLVKGLEE